MINVIFCCPGIGLKKIFYAPAKTIDQFVPSETIIIPIPAFTVETVEPPASFTVRICAMGRIT